MNRVWGWYPPPPFIPDCGQHQPHCLDHLLMLTDTNPTVIFQVQQGSLPASQGVGSQAWELSLLSCPQSALTQLCMHCQLDSPWVYITTPLFRWLERQFYRACFLSELSLSLSGFWILWRLFFFFLPQRIQSLQLLERRRWAGWRSCMRARQWCKKREHLIKLHARKSRSASVCSFSLP